MAQIFDGRFYSLAGDGDYIASLSDYYGVEYDPVGEDGEPLGGNARDSPPLEAGREGVYGYAYGIGGKDRVVKLETSKAQPGRSELRPGDGFQFYNETGPVFGEIWGTFEYYFPSGGWHLYEPVPGTSNGTDDGDGNHCNIFQVIQEHEDHDTARGPTMALQVEQKYINLRNIYDVDDPSVTLLPNLHFQSRKIRLPINRWCRFGFHLKSAYNTDGFIHLYMDDYLIWSETGTPNALNNGGGPYIKGGLYKYFGNPNGPTYPYVAAENFLYCGGWTLWDAASTYADVFGHADYGRRAARGVI